MPVNLIRDPWIPVRTHSGRQLMIRPAELGAQDDPPIELASDRPDFNGALAQWLAGLYQLAAAPQNENDLQRFIFNPPSTAEIDSVLSKLEFAFDLEGDKPFMQDAELDPQNLEPRQIDSLLLESPGDNALVNNTDLFVKRQFVSAYSAEYAALALMTLQINAPSGGQGHRTSLRGGGPLTTLIWPAEITAPTGERKTATLLQKVLLNLSTNQAEPPQDYSLCLPWIAPCLTSEKGRTVLEAWKRKPTELEELTLCFFATPRRIRLVWEGELPNRYCVGYITQNYGANYPSDAFQHPTSPYYKDKEANWLPSHIRSSGFGYRDFTSISAGLSGPDAQRRIASVVALANQSQRRECIGRVQTVWAFGFSLDNMKVLAWHEARYPLYTALDDQTKAILFAEAELLLAAADSAEKLAAQSVRKLNGDADLAMREFRSKTEKQFYNLLDSCCENPIVESRMLSRTSWRTTLIGQALRVFERYAESDVDSQSRLSKIKNAAQEHLKLIRTLGSVIDKALEITTAKSTGKIKPKEAA